MQKKTVTEKVGVHLLEAGNTFKMAGDRYVVTFVAGNEDYNGNHDGRYVLTCHPVGGQFEVLTCITVPANTTFKVRREVVKKDKDGAGWMSLREYQSRKENEKRRKSIVKANEKRRKKLKQTNRRPGGPYAMQRVFEELNLR